MKRIRLLSLVFAALQAGMNGHLAKPVDLKKMMVLLRELFKEDR